MRRGELSSEEALIAARLLQGADIELLPTRGLFEQTAQLAFELDHPACDCLYLALAVQNDCRFVTADESFLRKVGQARPSLAREAVVPLSDFAAGAADGH